jgi:hypothetical protein
MPRDKDAVTIIPSVLVCLNLTNLRQTMLRCPKYFEADMRS